MQKVHLNVFGKWDKKVLGFFRSESIFEIRVWFSVSILKILSNVEWPVGGEALGVLGRPGLGQYSSKSCILVVSSIPSLGSAGTPRGMGWVSPSGEVTGTSRKGIYKLGNQDHLLQVHSCFVEAWTDQFRTVCGQPVQTPAGSLQL